MSTPITTRAKLFISFCLLGAAGLAAHADWKVDFSRRITDTHSEDLRGPASDAPPTVAPQGDFSMAPASAPAQKSSGLFDAIFDSSQVAGEIVVLNTEKGFIPNTIRVRKGQTYEIHVVNVNEKEKNVSFVMDSFSEHHATYYGKIKSFVIHPQKEGVYRFESPETSAQGKLVVYPGPSATENRLPASE